MEARLTEAEAGCKGIAATNVDGAGELASGPTLGRAVGDAASRGRRQALAATACFLVR